MPLRILLLEDSDDDADLTLRELRKEGLEFTVQRVETESDYRRQLLEFAPALILADYSLPHYDGMSALALAREICPAAPFIFVSGTMGEETAIEALHHGATDYVLKQRMGRLGAAVRRALRDAELVRERHLADEILHETQANLARAESFSHIMVVHLALDGRWLKVPPLLGQLLGFTEAELLAGRIQDHLHPDDAAADWQQCQRLLQSDLKTLSSDKRFRNKDGQFLWFETNVTLVLNSQGEPERFLVYLRDLTEKKQLEAQFLRSQRLESVGRLASGIAHDLNNILAPILMAVPMLREEMTSEGNRRLLNTMESSALRGASIVKQVLAFGRGIDGQKAPLQPRHLLKEMAQIIKATFPKSITLRVLSPHDLWTVIGDATQLHQVLMNLCVNARDAMPAGGTLILAAGNIRLDETFTGKLQRLQPGPYVLLTVTDTGTGISPENLDRIFEPFFTTKPIDLGTGLGLSTVFGIVKSHGGVVLVASTLGQGTQFSIYLPATNATPLQPSAAEPGEIPKGNGELILVVDDEESIRAMTVRALQAHGYRTLAARDGAAAMALYASHRNDTQLVVTDLMMPVMDGIAMIHAMRKLSPEVKIIVTSGLSSHSMSTEAAALDVDAFLLKPYTITSLLNSLQDVLHRRGA